MRRHTFVEKSFALYRELGDKENSYSSISQGCTPSVRGMGLSTLLESAGGRLFKEMRQQHGTIVSLYALAQVATGLGTTRFPGSLPGSHSGPKGGRQTKYRLRPGRSGERSAARGGAWAARLWGAAEALREITGAPLPPVERPD